MKRIGATTIFLFLFIAVLFSQNLTQTVRGTVLDEDSKMPLIGAQVIILGSDPLLGTASDAQGNFRLDKVPIGRISIQVSYLGYKNAIIPNIVINSGKETLLNLSMQESAIKMQEVVITEDKNKGTALNDMAMISARSISPEQTNRYAGGFNDPSRILSNFAGITSTQDGSNDIIVRGNSPKYVQWRLEGIQISNPNHFADQSSVGGSVSTLNNNILATSDFHTGAFSAEFGDVLSGVYDVKLRAGNNEKFESVFGFGLIGTDLTLEGPFKKGYGGSYLVNYRYSTVSLIQDIGLVDNVNGALNFQDAAFKVVLPTKKLGVFSLFGLGGTSSFLFDDVTPALWETPGSNGMRGEIREDYQKRSHLLNLGLNHTLNLSPRSYLKTSLAYSNEGIRDDVFESQLIKIYGPNGEYLRDSAQNRNLNFSGRLSKPTYRAELTFHHKFNAKNKIQIGSKYSLFAYEFEQSQIIEGGSTRFNLIDFNENVGTLRNFVNWKHLLNNDLSIVAGVHNLNVLLNKKSTIEPRLALNWQLSPGSAIHAGYGLHSTMESIHNYFARVKQPDGSIAEVNRDLDLLKAHHFVLGYEKRFGQHLMAKVELYYQDLFNLPVENLDTSYYATINEGLEFRYVDLVNRGTGKNYGIEFTLERFFHRNYYFLFNTSLYQSKYRSLEGVERNTPYNGNYLVNLLFGKEIPKLGSKQNRTLGFNAKVFFGGGRKIIPLLRNNNGQLAVDPGANRFWDYSKAYERSLGDTYQVILSASYKWNRLRATHELFLNLDNVTNNKGKISEFYDESKPNSIGYLTQFGIFPNLMYRVYF